MTEKVLNDDEATALYGVTDPDTGVVIPNVTISNWGPARNRTDQRLVDVAKLANALRVYPVDDDPLAVGVRAGRCTIGDVVYSYIGQDPAVSGLTNNDTTYVWAQDNGADALEIASNIDATGWPTTPHIKLAEVVVTDGLIEQIVDRRSDTMLCRPATTAAMAAYGAWAIDGDGARTNGGGLVGDVLLTQADAAMAQVWDETTAAFLQLDGSSAGAGYTSDDQLLPDTPVVNDAAYFGHTVPFFELALDIATNAVHSGDALIWEYWDGDSWETLTLARDHTDTTAQDGLRSFQQSGAIHFVPPADWAANTINSQSAYWIRCRVTDALVTTAPVTNSVQHDTVTPLAGWAAPFGLEVIAIRAVDATTGAVHAANDVKFVLANFTSGRHSGELTWGTGKRSQSWPGLSLIAVKDDVLGVVVTQEDSMNEPVNVMIELTIIPTG